MGDDNRQLMLRDLMSIKSCRCARECYFELNSTIM